jgi:hypothetical protein
MSLEPVEVEPLSPDRLADFMGFFEGEAFSDNAKWSSCYCQCFSEDHSKVCWPDRTGGENRECASRRITRGEMQGLLAYQAGKAVAWCNAAPRTSEPTPKPTERWRKPLRPAQHVSRGGIHYPPK